MKEALSNAGVKYAYLDITESLSHLRNWVKLRETTTAFDHLKDKPQLGIPTLVIDDGAEIYFNLDCVDLESLKQ